MLENVTGDEQVVFDFVPYNRRKSSPVPDMADMDQLFLIDSGVVQIFLSQPLGIEVIDIGKPGQARWYQGAGKRSEFQNVFSRQTEMLRQKA